MRNLVVLQDRIYQICTERNKISNKCPQITSYFTDSVSKDLFVLLDNGRLLSFNCGEFDFKHKTTWDLNIDGVDTAWFDVAILPLNGSIACISHSGAIVTIANDIGTGSYSSEVELVGAIDNGISSAQWNPDYSMLVIATNNSSLISMTHEWDVIEEVPLPTLDQHTVTTISWRGDGDSFSLLSTDVEDKTTKVRVYNRELEVTAISRNVAENAAGVMKNIGDAAAFATNGSYIALSQERVRNKPQVCVVN